MTVFALYSDMKLVTMKDLLYIAHALEENARHCADHWERSPPAVAVVDRWAGLEGNRTVHPVVFTGELAPSGTLAEHWWSASHRGPAARVYVEASSGLDSGQYSLVESAGHEIVEAMIDPAVNLWSTMPGHQGLQVALEVADPTQDTYVAELDGKSWRLANFVTPAWFDSRLVEDGPRKAFLAAGGRFDHAGRMSAPGELLRSGYAILRRPKDAGGWTQYPIYGSSDAPDKVRAQAKLHPWSRSVIRGCGTTETAMAKKANPFAKKAATGGKMTKAADAKQDAKMMKKGGKKGC